MLSLTIFLPLLGALILTRIDRENRTAIRWIALSVSFIDFLITLGLLLWFDQGSANYQFTEQATWIGSLGLQYHVGVDGLSMLMIFLTGLLSWISILSTWNAIQVRVKEFMIAF